jgi:hypothetical protein
VQSFAETLGGFRVQLCVKLYTEPPYVEPSYVEPSYAELCAKLYAELCAELRTDPTAHSHPHYTLKKYAFYNKMYILRIISGFS